MTLVLAATYLKWPPASDFPQARVEGPLVIGATMPISPLPVDWLVSADSDAEVSSDSGNRCSIGVIGSPDCAGCRFLARNLSLGDDRTESGEEVHWFFTGTGRAIAHFARKFGLGDTHVSWLVGSEGETWRRLGVSTSPTLVFVDREGVVQGLLVSNDLPDEAELAQFCARTR